jgi:DNA-binding CsgD family transcriptional regulator/PAS domain-containing protein
MARASDADDLIPAVYEAAVDPEGWTAALAAIARAAGATTVLMATCPIGRRMAEAAFSTHNFEPGAVAGLLREGVIDASVYAEATLIRPVGAITDLASFDSRIFASDPLAQTLLHPQDLREGVFMAADRDTEVLVVFGLFNEGRRGPLGPAGLRLMARLAPHLRRAHRAQRRVVAAADGLRLLQAALETMGVGVLGLGADLRIVLANPEAERILAQGDGLRQARGRLAIAAPGAEATLAAAVGAALSDRHDGAGPHLAVPRRSGAPDVMLHVCPRGVGRKLRLPPGVAAVLVTDPLRPVAMPDAAALAARFGLTAAEAEVARLAATGRGMPFVAHVLGVSVNTARTHLKAVYAKTGFRHQAELARRIATDFPPVRAAATSGGDGRRGGGRRG